MNTDLHNRWFMQCKHVSQSRCKITTLQKARTECRGHYVVVPTARAGGFASGHRDVGEPCEDLRRGAGAGHERAVGALSGCTGAHVTVSKNQLKRHAGPRV